MEKVLPQHVGIIMDGNGRWAKLRGLPRQAGHKAGAAIFKRIIRYCGELGIRFVTVYAFSTENWKRSEEEIHGLLDLLQEYLDDSKSYYEDNVKIRFIGDLSPFQEGIQTKIKACEESTAAKNGITVNIALNYGGRNEILQAVKKIALQVRENKIAVDDITEPLFDKMLYTAGQPDVDLIIRPSGENRLSNFMLWQSAYAEYVSMDVLWPDFTEREMDKALAIFAKRNRRFGAAE